MNDLHPIISPSAQAQFHRERAAQELGMAERANDAVTAKLHRELARFHNMAVGRYERPVLKLAIDR